MKRASLYSSSRAKAAQAVPAPVPKKMAFRARVRESFRKNRGPLLAAMPGLAALLFVVFQWAHTPSQQQLTQAQDRFAAGVANGLEVTQAQEAVATADENYISSVYALNISEAAIGRAIGSAERTIKSFFGAK